MIRLGTKAAGPDARASTDADAHQASSADGLGVGSHVTSARSIDFTADLYEIHGGPVAKRGRIPGLTPSPRLAQVL